MIIWPISDDAVLEERGKSREGKKAEKKAKSVRRACFYMSKEISLEGIVGDYKSIIVKGAAEVDTWASS